MLHDSSRNEWQATKRGGCPSLVCGCAWGYPLLGGADCDEHAWHAGALTPTPPPPPHTRPPGLTRLGYPDILLVALLSGVPEELLFRGEWAAWCPDSCRVQAP